MEFHPDQNQDNKGNVTVNRLYADSSSLIFNHLFYLTGRDLIVADVAEAKFKEVLLSYEAIKEERKEV